MWEWWLILFFAWLAGARYLWRRQYLDPVSAIFLNQDPWLRANIHAVFILANPVTVEVLREWAEGTLWQHPRFRDMVVRRRWLWPYWSPARHLRLEDHLIHHVLPQGQRGQSGLENYVSSLLMKSMGEGRPPWELHLVDTDMEGGSALVFRAHHCLGDGVGLLRVAVSMLPRAHGGIGGEPLSPMSPLSPLSPVSPSSGGATSSSTGHSRSSLHKRNQGAFATLCDAARAVLKLLLMKGDGATSLKASTPMAQSDPVNVSWSRQPVPLTLLKQIARSCRCTVNDVLFASLASGLRAYLQRAGRPIPRRMQAVLWVSLAGLDLSKPPDDLANRLGALYLSLPLDTRDAADRIENVRRQTAALVSSPEPVIAGALMRLFGLLPEAIARPLWNALAFKVSASMSNLPGPQFQLEIANSPIHSFIFMVPPQRTIGHFLTVLSYNGTVHFGAASDQHFSPRSFIVVRPYSPPVRLIIALLLNPGAAWLRSLSPFLHVVQRLVERPAELIECIHSELQVMAKRIIG